MAIHRRQKKPEASADAVSLEDSILGETDEPEYQDAEGDLAQQQSEGEYEDAEDDVVEEEATSLLTMPTPSADNEQSQEGATFIERQLGRVPIVGRYVGSMLSSRSIRTITQKADPFMEAAAQRGASCVEMARCVPGVIQAAPQQLYQSATEAPGRVLQGIRAMPRRANQTAQKVRVLPAQAHEAMMLTSASLMERGKVTSRNIRETISNVPGKLSEKVEGLMAVSGRALQISKGLPRHVYDSTVNIAAQLVQKIQALPARTYNATILTASSIVDRAKSLFMTLRGKVVNVAASVAESVANAAQPYVHRIVKVVAPRAESVANNQHVQSMYHHRLVQGGIEKASPYVSKVAKQPAILEILETLEIAIDSVVVWALPAM